jgi:poly-gamma-glutamate synthesis protein (capsule biosynthesis protein)
MDQNTSSSPIDNETVFSAPHTPSDRKELSFAIAGDIMVHESQIHAAYDEQSKTYDFAPVFSPVAPLFSAADITIANLETTLPGKEYSGYPAFGAPDSLIDAIKSSGINILTTANNHCIDKGKAALVRTLRVLDEKGIPHLGTYASKEEYEKQRVFLLEQNGISVAMLNYTYGTNEIPTPKGTVVNRIDKEQISKDIALAKTGNADAIIVLLHFGEEYLNKPDAFQREMVSHALANGADIVIGGHPHHVQPYEVFHRTDSTGIQKQHLVAYSLGNFVSAQRRRYTDGGMVLYFTLVKHQGTSGKTKIDIADVHHKLVWVHVGHHAGKKQFHILPIESYLISSGELKLSHTAIEEMKRFRADADEVLGIRESEIRLSEN